MPKDVTTECVVNYVEEGEKTASMYESSALDQKDQYEVFFGGNHSRIDITTPVNENKNLLIFKDSYANCFIPLLQPYFRSITVIDPRYYYDDVDRLITDNSITDVLFLYNVDTFMTDTSLADSLEPMPESETSDTGTAGTAAEEDAPAAEDTDGTSQAENPAEDSSQDSQTDDTSQDNSEDNTASQDEAEQPGEDTSGDTQENEA